MRKLLISAAIVMSLASVNLVGTPLASATTTQLGSLSIISVPLDQRTITVTPPTSNSPGQWSISLDTPSLASINGLTLTLLGVGSGQLTFTQAASGTYTSASRTTVFRVTPATPVLGNWAAAIAPLSTGQFKIVPPTSTSTGSWLYSLSNNVANGYSIATLSGTTVTLLDAGAVTINATQLATPTYKSATVSTTLQITALKPVIGPFSDLTVSRDSVGSFNLRAPTSTSPGAWTFTSSLPSVAALAGTLVTPLTVGTTVITAHQVPAAGYQSTTVTMNLTVSAAPPTVGTLAPINYIFGSNPNNTLLLTPPTSNSPGSWSFTVADPSVATVSGNTLVILKGGTTTISAKQNPVGNFGFSAVVTTPLVVSQLTTITPLPNLNQVVGDPSEEITLPTTQSTGAWTVTSSDPSVVTVSGLSISFGDAGTAKVTLTQAAQGIWLANSTSFTVTVAGLVPTIGTLAPIILTVGQAPLSVINPTSNSAGVWSYSTGNSAIAKIVNGQVVPVVVGITTISGVQKAAGKYGQSNTVKSTITVLALPTLTGLPNLSMTLGEAPVVVPAPKSDSPGLWSWSSSAPAVATVNNGTITALSAGTAKITVTQASTASFGTASESFTVTVKPIPVVTPTPTPKPTVKPTPKPTVKPTVKPTPKPTTTKLPVVPIVTVKAVGRILTITAKGGVVVVHINGKLGVVGKNTVAPGNDLVIIEFQSRVIYSKVFAIK